MLNITQGNRYTLNATFMRFGVEWRFATVTAVNILSRLGVKTAADFDTVTEAKTHLNDGGAVRTVLVTVPATLAADTYGLEIIGTAPAGAVTAGFGEPVRVAVREAFRVTATTERGDTQTVTPADRHDILMRLTTGRYAQPAWINTLAENATAIGNGMYRGQYTMRWIDIPKTVTTIGQNAFAGCASLQRVTIPDTVTSIGEYAFSGCRQLAQVYGMDKVTTIPQCAFARCQKLDTIGLGAVTAIAINAFSNCLKLMAVQLPKVVDIGEYAFSNCHALQYLALGPGCKKIGQYALTVAGIAGHLQVSCYAATPPTLVGDTGNIMGSADNFIAVMYVPDDSLDKYKRSDWAKYVTEFKTLTNLDAEGTDEELECLTLDV